jgi:hypothetical protein
MNQSAMAAPIDRRCVSDEPNNATNVAASTAAPAVIPTVERRSNVMFRSWIVVFVFEKILFHHLLLLRVDRRSAKATTAVSEVRPGHQSRECFLQRAARHR